MVLVDGCNGIHSSSIGICGGDGGTNSIGSGYGASSCSIASGAGGNSLSSIVGLLVTTSGV